LRRDSRVSDDASRACACAAPPRHRRGFSACDGSLQQGLGAIVGHLGVRKRGLGHIDVSLLDIRIDGEQRSALVDSVAFAHRQVLNAAVLIGTDKDQIGLDPALEAGARGLPSRAASANARHRELQSEARS